MTQARRGWTLQERNPTTIRALMPVWEWLYHHYFRVQTQGWEHIPASGPVLFVGSHNGGLAAPDMHMMMYDWFRRFGIEERPVYGLMHAKMSQAMPLIANMAIETGAIMAHPKMAIAALKSGASVLVYPGGVQDVFRPHRDRGKIHLAGNVAFIKLALRQQVPIVPAISWGAHDSLVILADLYPWVKQLHARGLPWFLGIDPEVFPLYLGLPWGLSIGPLPNLPLPVQIHTQVLPPIEFSRYGTAAVQDADYVQDCYHLVESTMQQALDQLAAIASTSA